MTCNINTCELHRTVFVLIKVNIHRQKIWSSYCFKCKRPNSLNFMSSLTRVECMLAVYHALMWYYIDKVSVQCPIWWRINIRTISSTSVDQYKMLWTFHFHFNVCYFLNERHSIVWMIWLLGRPHIGIEKPSRLELAKFTCIIKISR